MVSSTTGFVLFQLTLSEWANWSSLASFLLTIAVYVSVREIRRGVMHKIRAPELIKQLKEHRAAINTFLLDFPRSSGEHQRKLPELDAILLALEDKIGWYFSSGRSRVRAVRQLVESHEKNPKGRSGAETLYDKLTFLIVHLEQDGRDRQWQV